MSILDGTTDMTSEMDELARLRAENEALKAKMAEKKSKGEGITVVVKHEDIEKEFVLSLKASEKGAVSIYGMGRFPLTAYPLALLAILGISDEIREFILKNVAKLSFAKKEA